MNVLRGSDFPSQRFRANTIVHFTESAADPLTTFAGARFVVLMEGQGNSHVSCPHLDSNARIASPSLTHAAALLCVYGRITVTTLWTLIDRLQGGPIAVSRPQ
jgi:hypothetical protein